MLNKFQSYIQAVCKTAKHERILVAVSGGIDSMCLFHLLKSSGFEISVAHCNFKLRGKESDDDEKFVEALADKNGVPCHTKHFETLEFSRLQKINIQMAARELRYSWFENLRRTINYDKIAIAHNSDDNIETFFINLLRGAGIQGITGIKPISNNIIRPLLFASRSEIEQYSSANNIAYRTDSSNLSDKYLRNKLRNKILPAFTEINSEFKTIMLQNICNFEQAENIYTTYIERAKKQIITIKDEDEIKIDIQAIESSAAPKTVLFEILKQYGFSAKTTEEIYSCLHAGSGKQFFSKSVRAIIDRNCIIICALKEINEDKFYILEDTLSVDSPISMNINVLDNEGYKIKYNPYIAALDMEKLVFPLTLRKWHNGDFFQPLGMKGIKKVSDFFIDCKLSLTDKENTWILTSANEIVWIVGMRIDDKYKITNNTKKIYEIEI
jgi:tRNA(Ile)-lysidine synthase